MTTNDNVLIELMYLRSRINAMEFLTAALMVTHPDKDGFERVLKSALTKNLTSADKNVIHNVNAAVQHMGRVWGFRV